MSKHHRGPGAATTPGDALPAVETPAPVTPSVFPAVDAPVPEFPVAAPPLSAGPDTVTLVGPHHHASVDLMNGRVTAAVLGETGAMSEAGWASPAAGVDSASTYTLSTLADARLDAATRQLVGTTPPIARDAGPLAGEIGRLMTHPDATVRARAAEAAVAIRAGAPSAGILARAARDIAAQSDGRR